jgi:peptidyl-prolyl cis-trans isomerase D
MAIIGKIRAKSGLAVGVVGGALILFILADAFKGIFTPDAEPVVHASVYGQPVDMQKVSETEQMFLANADAQARQQGRDLTKEDRERIKEQAFQEEVRKIIMGKQLEALGIEVNSEELNFLVKGDGTLLPAQDIQNIFRDSLGQFSMQALNNFLQRLPNLEPEGKKQWQQIEQNLKDNRMTQKYVSLVARSMYVTDLEAKRKYKSQNEYKQVQFVLKRYNEAMADTNNDVTEAELKAYYEEHKNEKKYEQKLARKFAYVQIPFMPSQADYERFDRNLNRLKRAFAKTSKDSSFVVKNSGAKKYDPNAIYSVGPYQPGNTTSYPAEMADSIDAANIGDVVGPYKYGPTVCIAKKVGMRDQKLAWVRHILIKADTANPNGRSFAEAKSLSDSLISVIKKNDNFKEIVTNFSEDQGSVYNGGEYKWFPEGQMVPTFNDASFNGAIGKLQLVKTTFGYHIVEVLGRKDQAPILAIVQKEVKAGDAANDAAYEKGLSIMNKMYENKEQFAQIAQDSGYLTKDGYVNIESPRLFNINKGQQSILKFVFNSTASKGDVSSPILIDEGMYGIFQISDVIEEGTPSFETVKEQMKFEAKKAKIAAKFIEQMSGKNTLEDVAAAVNGEVVLAKVNFESTSIQGAGGNEPNVVGAIFSGLQKGQMTVPIEGVAGVYVVLVTDVLTPQETTDYSAQKAELKSTISQNVSGKIYSGLLEQADLKDDRKKIEFGAK